MLSGHILGCDKQEMPGAWVWASRVYVCDAYGHAYGIDLLHDPVSCKMCPLWRCLWLPECFARIFIRTSGTSVSEVPFQYSWYGLILICVQIREDPSIVSHLPSFVCVCSVWVCVVVCFCMYEGAHGCIYMLVQMEACGCHLESSSVPLLSLLH